LAVDGGVGGCGTVEWREDALSSSKAFVRSAVETCATEVGGTVDEGRRLLGRHGWLKVDGVFEIGGRSIANTLQLATANLTVAQHARCFLQLNGTWELIDGDEWDEDAVATVDDVQGSCHLGGIYR